VKLACTNFARITGYAESGEAMSKWDDLGAIARIIIESAGGRNLPL
jgi:hypothetical protein